MKANYLKLSPLLLLAGMLPASAQATDPSPPIDPSPSLGLETGITTTTTNSAAGLSSTRVNTRDVGSRLFRKRAGVPLHEHTTTTPGATSAKGGMSKEPIVVTEPAKWEVWGGLFYYTEESDSQLGLFRPGVGANPVQVLVAGDTDFDLFGGSIGVERRINQNFMVGFAISASSGEAETDLNGFRLNSTDVDALSFIPYVSYQRANAIFGADYWADLMYAYTDQSYDITRNNFGALAGASPDGSTHTIDFNTGLTFHGGRVNHGPYVGLRWIDGDIDGYQEYGVGGGALFPSQDIESLASTVGYSVSGVFQSGGGAWVPQAKAAWEHEFEDDGGNVFGFPLGTVDEDIAVLGLGVGYYANSGWNAVLDYEARLGSEVEGHYVGLKVGKEF